METNNPTGLELSNLEHIAKTQLPVYEQLNERFCRVFRTALSKHIAKVCNVEQLSNKQEKFGSVVKRYPVPSHLFVYKILPHNQFGIFVLDHKLTSALTDLSFGGKSLEKFAFKARELTKIEQRVISKVVLIALESIVEAWQNSLNIELQFQSYEPNPLMLNVFQATDINIVSDYSLKIDEREFAFSNLLPRQLIQNLNTTSQQVLVRQDKDTHLRLRESVTGTEAEISVELASGKATLENILNLKVGDVIELETSASEDALIKVQGKPKFKGKIGAKSGRRAASITKLLFD